MPRGREDSKYSFRLAEPVRNGKRGRANDVFQSKSPSPSAPTITTSAAPKKQRLLTPPPTTPSTLAVPLDSVVPPHEQAAISVSPDPAVRERHRSRSPEHHSRRSGYRTDERRRYEEPAGRLDERDYRDHHHPHHRRDRRSSKERYGFRAHDHHHSHRRRPSPHRIERDRDWRARDYDRDRERERETFNRDYDREREPAGREYDRRESERESDSLGRGYDRERSIGREYDRDRDSQGRDVDRDRDCLGRDYDHEREPIRRGHDREREIGRQRLSDEGRRSTSRVPSIPPPPPPTSPPQLPPPPPENVAEDMEIGSTPEPPEVASEEPQVEMRAPEAPWKAFQWTPEFKVYRSIEKHFDNLELIGQGTFGKVWKATMKDNGRVVALKQVTDKRNRNQLFTVPNLRELKFFSLHHHPNILELLGVVSFDEKSGGGGDVEVNEYLVLEYMDHDLAGLMQHIPNKRLYEVQHLKCMAKQLFEGLDYMHCANVMHRDLKVANLLMSNQGQLKIADFGFARDKDDCGQDGYTNRVCTIWYRPLEVILGERHYGYELDMWSAGCVLAEMFLKQPLFHTQMGLETEQATRIFSILGHPTESADWQYLKGLGWAEMLKKPDRHFPRRLESYLVERSARHVPIPPMAVDLIVKLLSFDPTKRPNAKEALSHPFFTTEQPLACAPRDIPSIDGSFHEFECKERNKQKKNPNFMGTHLSRRRESGTVTQQQPDPTGQPPVTPSERRGMSPPPESDPAITRDEHRGLWYDARSNCVFDGKAGRWIDIMEYDRVHFPEEYWKFVQTAERERSAAAPSAQSHAPAGPYQHHQQQHSRSGPGDRPSGPLNAHMHTPSGPHPHHHHQHRAFSGPVPFTGERGPLPNAQPLPSAGSYPHYNQPLYRATPGPSASERPPATPSGQMPPYGSYHHHQQQQQQRSAPAAGPGFHNHQGPGLGYRQREPTGANSRHETPVPHRHSHAPPQQYRAGMTAHPGYPQQQQRPELAYPPSHGGHNPKRARSPASPLSPRSSRHDLGKRRRMSPQNSPSSQRGRGQSREGSNEREGNRTAASSPSSSGSPMSMFERGAQAKQRKLSPMDVDPTPDARTSQEHIVKGDGQKDLAGTTSAASKDITFARPLAPSSEVHSHDEPGVHVDADPRVAGDLGSARLVDLRRRQPRGFDGALELVAPPDARVWYPKAGHLFDPQQVKPFVRRDVGAPGSKSKSDDEDDRARRRGGGRRGSRGPGILAALDVF
ncbi:Cyclin-dependent kinase 12 [Geranomyces michiganensis]|nr:Cyclin-dependent kinase 12 [Geranomyces michiganensis]